MTFSINRTATLIFIIALIFSSSLTAIGQTAKSGDFSSALDASGRVRSDAVGSFNAEGYAMKQGPNGEPIFVKPSDEPESPMTPCTDTYDRRFVSQGITSTVWTVAFDSSGNIYIGGDFTTIGSKRINRVAKWDGVSWSGLGSGIGDGSVRDLHFSPGGTLYATGTFTLAGGVTAKGIAKWSGGAWSPVGDGTMTGTSFVLGSKVVSDSEIYIGGTFTGVGGVTVSNFAKWDGSAWSGLGTGTNDWVWAIEKLGSDIYVGGSFTSINSVTANRVAKWNGTTWSAVGTGITNGNVTSLKANSAETTLYAGGTFTASGATTLSRVAKWNGTAWSPLVSGATTNLINSNVEEITISGDDLYIAGWFTEAGGQPHNRVVKFNLTNSTWSSLGAGVASTARVVAPRGTDVYVGGAFTSKGDGTPLSWFGKWDGSNWSEFLEDSTGKGWLGSNGYVLEMIKDSSGNIYVAGGFSKMGDLQVANIAKWNGNSWERLGDGLNAPVRDIIWGPDGHLYAAGDFTASGNVTAKGVAKWNGTAWSGVGVGLNSAVYEIAFDSNGKLYAAGAFTKTGDDLINIPPRAAVWDGTTWASLGSAGNAGASVGLGIDSANNVYVAAAIAGCGRVAKWNGTAWSCPTGAVNPVGGGSAGIAVEPNGTIYLVGNIQLTGAPSSDNGVAKWDGTTWSYLGNLSSQVYRLKIRPEGLVALGAFTDRDSGATNAALWNGTAWTAMAPGLGALFAYELDRSGVPMFGGSLSTAGCTISTGIARYSTAPFTGGAGTTDWHTPGNWNTGTVPTQLSSFMIPTGTVSISSADAAARDLEVGEGATLTIANGRTLFVHGNLNVLGTITGGTVHALNCDVNAVTNPGPGYIKGTLVRCVDGTRNGTYAFPVGTDNGFSGVRLFNTTGLGDVSVKPVQSAATATGLPTPRLQRYWTIEEVFVGADVCLGGPNGVPCGVVSTDISFDYLQSDITGNESLYRVYRISGGSAQYRGSSINTTLNRATVFGVTQFSDWTLAEGVPTAAPAVMGGRVLGTDGRPVANAKVLLTKPDGDVVTVQTNNFGNFRFTGLKSGETYVVMAQTRRDLYMPQVVNLSDNITDLVLRP